MRYLEEGVKAYQHWVSCLKRDGVGKDQGMVAEQEFTYLKPVYLSGFIYLAELQADRDKKLDMLHDVVYLVPRILQTVAKRGETYLGVEAFLFTALGL